MKIGFIKYVLNDVYINKWIKMSEWMRESMNGAGRMRKLNAIGLLRG